MPSTLERWLADLERRHPREIELGLDRVGRVWRALGAPRPARSVITVGGTNGKGSTVAFIEAAARRQGWRTGAYTSPHLERYNERIRIDGSEAGDAAIVAAFGRIEATRDGVPLTYFEVGTLAALLIMAENSRPLDLAILEVGLGGRLDAVNLIDADVAVVTTVALDHQAWLGDTRALIGREKAGIARPEQPFVIAEADPEPALVAAARAAGAHLVRRGIDFDLRTDDDGRRWFRYGDEPALALPARLRMRAPGQWDNAAAALAALRALQSRVPGGDAPAKPAFAAAEAAAALADVELAGRLELLSRQPEILADVGHNPQAAQALAQWLREEAADRPTDAVFSALADKDVTGIVEPLLPLIRNWHVCGLADQSSRGLAAEAIAGKLAGVIPAGRMQRHPIVPAALEAASRALGPDQRLLAFGSFHVVAQARKWARTRL